MGRSRTQVRHRALDLLCPFTENPTLQQEIAAGMADIKAGRVAAGKNVIKRMRKRIRDAGL